MRARLRGAGVGGGVCHATAPRATAAPQAFGKSLRYAGCAMKYDADGPIIHGDDSDPDGSFTAYYVSENKVVAVAVYNGDPEAVAAQALFKLGRMVAPAVLMEAGGGRFSLRAYLASIGE